MPYNSTTDRTTQQNRLPLLTRSAARSANAYTTAYVCAPGINDKRLQEIVIVSESTCRDAVSRKRSPPERSRRRLSTPSSPSPSGQDRPRCPCPRGAPSSRSDAMRWIPGNAPTRRPLHPSSSRRLRRTQLARRRSRPQSGLPLSSRKRRTTKRRVDGGEVERRPRREGDGSGGGRRDDDDDDRRDGHEVAGWWDGCSRNRRRKPRLVIKRDIRRLLRLKVGAAN